MTDGDALNERLEGLDRVLAIDLLKQVAAIDGEARRLLCDALFPDESPILAEVAKLRPRFAVYYGYREAAPFVEDAVVALQRVQALPLEKRYTVAYEVADVLLGAIENIHDEGEAGQALDGALDLFIETGVALDRGKAVLDRLIELDDVAPDYNFVWDAMVKLVRLAPNLCERLEVWLGGGAPPVSDARLRQLYRAAGKHERYLALARANSDEPGVVLAEPGSFTAMAYLPVRA